MKTPFPGVPAPTHASYLALAFLVVACSSGSDAGGDGPGPFGGGGPNLDNVTPGAYLPDDGLIVVEMESGAVGGSWAEQTSFPGFTGSSYLTWTGSNEYSTPGVDTFGFDLWIEDPGTYSFRIHNRHDDPDSTLANDLWARMDDGPWVKTFSWERAQWSWATQHEFSHSNKPPASYSLTAGNHRIEFSGRSFEFSADRFHLFDSGVADPMNTAYPESNRAGVSNLEAGPGGAGFIGASPGQSSLVTLSPASIWPEASDALGAATDLSWTIPGASFADGTHGASLEPVAVVDGGVALPVVLAGTVKGDLVAHTGVLNVEGGAILSGELRVGSDIELLFQGLEIGSVELAGPNGERVDGVGVSTLDGTRVTVTAASEGTWRYRARDETQGMDVQGAFLVLAD